MGGNGSDERLAGLFIVVHALAQQHAIGFGTADGQAHERPVAAGLPHRIARHAHIVHHGTQVRQGMLYAHGALLHLGAEVDEEFRPT